MTGRININDITFLIPVRIDSITRLENIFLVTDFLSLHFNTNIKVLEASGYNNQILSKLLPASISLTFVEDWDPIFHRTKYINQLVRACNTNYIAVWDSDVLVPPEQITKSIQLLRANNADFIYPYGKNFLDTTSILRELYIKTRNLDLLMKHTGKMKKLYLPVPIGGAFLANRTAYMESGMENKSFYGWGREDGDRFNRWKILEYTYKRIPGSLFHLTHKRAENSTFHSAEQKNIKISEIHRIGAMSQKELKAEISTW